MLWETFRRHYGGKGDKLILVAKGASRVLNPSLPVSVVARAYARDPVSAAAEYGGNFRADIEAFVSLEVVEACVEHLELPPAEHTRYYAACDPSGGSSDSMALAVAFAHGPRVTIAAVREVRPPFSPEAVVDEFCTLLKTYRITRVVGDHFGGEFVKEPFRKRGIEYRLADRPKSAAYQALLAQLNSGGVVLPRSERLVNQLVGLERRVSRGGKDSIDHSPGGHDDLANCVALVCSVVANARQIVPPTMGTWSDPFIGFRRLREQETAAAAAEKACSPWVHPLTGATIVGSRPCEIDFAKLERERQVPEALTRKTVGPPRIW